METQLEPKKNGRPTLFNEGLSELICGRLAEGVLIGSVASELGISVKVINEWRGRYPSFSSAYARAEAAGFDMLAEKLLTISQDKEGDVQRQRLESDNLKWFLSKRAAKTYGDRIDVNVNQTIDISQALSEARSRALRPISDQHAGEEIQDVDFKEINSTNTPDKQSDSGQDGTQTQDEKADRGA